MRRYVVPRRGTSLSVRIQVFPTFVAEQSLKILRGEGLDFAHVSRRRGPVQVVLGLFDLIFDTYALFTRRTVQGTFQLGFELPQLTFVCKELDTVCGGANPIQQIDTRDVQSGQLESLSSAPNTRMLPRDCVFAPAVRCSPRPSRFLRRH